VLEHVELVAAPVDFEVVREQQIAMDRQAARDACGAATELEAAAGEAALMEGARPPGWLHS